MSGWNKPTERPVETKKAAKPAFKHVLIASGVVAVLGCVLLLVFSGGGEKSKAKAEKKAAAIKEVKPAATAKVDVKPLEAKREKAKNEVLSCHTNSDSGIVYERVRRPDGSTMTIQHKPDPVFSNLCDNVIAMVIGSERGNIPPLPPVDENRLRESFLQSVVSPVKVLPTDSEKVAAMKLAVQAYRQAIEENLKAGDSRSILAMIQDHIQDANDKFALKAEAIRQIREDCADADAEFRKEYVGKVNAYLEKYGVSPVKFDDSENTERKKR